MKDMKHLTWVFAGALIGAALAYGNQGQDVSGLANKTMPSFKMTTFAGKSISSASLKGKPYILDFWATWCGPCKAASPTMQALHQKYASKGLMVIGANTSEDDGGKKAMGYPKQHKYTYTFTKNNDALAGKLGVQGLPTFVFVDKRGKVVAVETGFSPSQSPAMFEKYVAQMMK